MASGKWNNRLSKNEDRPAHGGPHKPDPTPPFPQAPGVNSYMTAAASHAGTALVPDADAGVARGQEFPVKPQRYLSVPPPANSAIPLPHPSAAHHQPPVSPFPSPQPPPNHQPYSGPLVAPQTQQSVKSYGEGWVKPGGNGGAATVPPTRLPGSTPTLQGSPTPMPPPTGPIEKGMWSTGPMASPHVPPASPSQASPPPVSTPEQPCGAGAWRR